MSARYRSLPVFLMLCLLATAGRADAQQAGHPISMWLIQGASNRIYLLGSIHVLRQSDHPIPTAIEDAYEDAEVLIMEVDMDDFDPLAMLQLVDELGLIQDGRSLQELMGPGPYDEASQVASQLNIPIDMLARTEPWLAAITVEQLMLLRIGFDPEFGIEFHFTSKAGKDNKEIRGFESAREQLEFLDHLSLPAQRALLIQTLHQSLNLEQDLNQLIDAWRNGDVEFLEDNMLDDMRQYPELYKTLVTDRNEAWVQRIKSLTEDDTDYLIVVGALHLVGEDGVPNLLSKTGITVNQLREPGG